MNRSKLEELLRQLDEQKLKHFGEFILSPYHNKNKNLIKLYNYFSKSKFKEPDYKISKPEVYSYLFSGRNFNKQKIELLLSEFKSLLVEFILTEELRSNSQVIKNDMLLKLFDSGSLTKNYESTLKEIRKLYQLDLNRTYRYYFYKLNAEFNYANLNILNIMYGRDKNKLQLLEENANLLFMEIKLELLILILRHIKECGKDLGYKIWQKENIIKYITSNLELIKKEHPVIFALYMITRLYTTKNSDKYYIDLKTYLYENFNKFSPEMVRDLFTELNNYCDDRLIINRQKYSKEMFEIYRILDEKQIYTKLRVIEHFDFMNAIYLGLEQKQKSWVKSFYNKYKDKIDPALKNDLISLTKANIMFDDGNFSDALTELNYITSNEFYFYIRIKLLRAKIYFEINDIESARYIIDSLKHYIKRNSDKLKITSEVIRNFIEYFNILLRLKEKSSSENNLKILKKIRAEQNIVAKFWLIDKFKESF